MEPPLKGTTPELIAVSQQSTFRYTCYQFRNSLRLGNSVDFTQRKYCPSILIKTWLLKICCIKSEDWVPYC